MRFVPTKTPEQQNAGHDTNTLLDAIQHPQAELANLQHGAADAMTAHDAQNTTIIPDVHTSNLHAGAFHLV